jgi:hypothetical protein
MNKNRLPLLFILPVFLVFSCGSNPNVEQPQGNAAVTGKSTAVKEESAVVTERTTAVTQGSSVQVEEAFDPSTVSQEYYNFTLEEVRHFINDLNQIIRSRNYNLWRAALSDEYFREISSPTNLQQLSEQPAMRTRKIVLKTPQDYFTHVVVPSRANSQVDVIEFVSRNRVKAFTIIPNRSGGEPQRLRLYDLEKINDIWTIIN